MTGATSSSISLSWTETNNNDPASSYRVCEGTNVVATSTTTGATVSRVTMLALGNFNSAAATTEPQYHIGTLDLKYKLDHGYISYAASQSGILVDDHSNPPTDGPNVKGFLYDWDAYTVAGSPQS